MTEQRTAEGVQDLLTILSDLGLEAEEARPSGANALFTTAVQINGKHLAVEVKRDVRDADAYALVAQMPAPFLVVADRLSPKARTLLTQHHAGWLDRRGHLHLDLPPGIFINTDIEPTITVGRDQGANPFTSTGLDVSIALLLAPTELLGVREIARRTENSVGRVSELLSQLRGQGLVNRDGSPAIPDLFDATVAAWHPRWATLGRTPRPDATLRLSGSLGAISLGAPLAVSDGWPPELYVRDEFALRRLVQTYPPDVAQNISPAAKVAVCPSTYGFDQASDERCDWPVVNHVVIALDLAQDQGRGREALEAWEPAGVFRVW